MNILMMTNTFTPHVGGVARSVEAFTEEYRRRGHRVLVVAPSFADMPLDEVDVVRIPAIPHFNGSDFSLALPIPGLLTAALDDFDPDIVHAHHPFRIGATALRVAALRECPLAFTHHTFYEHYTHYLGGGDSAALKRFVVSLSASYANLCDQVFAPSRAVAAVLRARGVEAPVAVVPTGVRLDRFVGGDGAAFRARHGIPAEAFVVGHVGRLAAEKNLGFLAAVVAAFLAGAPGARFLLVGSGPMEPAMLETVERAGVAARVHRAGALAATDLAAAYAAMDAFAFASKSETQGMVLTEAMAAGVPVVALDASAVREVVVDGRNGRLLAAEDAEAFAAALGWLAGLPAPRRAALRAAARQTAEAFSLGRSAERALALYDRLLGRSWPRREWREEAEEARSPALHRLAAEWELLKTLAGAAGAALAGERAGAKTGP